MKSELIESPASTKELVTFKSMAELKSYADEVAKTGFTPLNTGAKVLAAFLTGKELGFGYMFSANNIYPISGKATLGVHAINYLLLKNGIEIEVLRDYEPCVNFVLKGEDGNPALFDKTTGKEVKRNQDGKVPENSVTQPVREGFIDEAARDYEVKGKLISNYKTVIKLTRKLRQPDGTFKEFSMIDSFSRNEAIQADLMGKSNWKNFTKAMCYARALVFAGRRIADDILGGLPETSEYADTKNISYSYNEGTIIIQEKEGEKPKNPVENASFEEVKEESPSKDGEKDKNSSED